MVLGIDCTTHFGQLVLCDQGKVLNEISWSHEKSHSDVITQNISKLLSDANVEFNQLTALCGFNGPGSFTGIRVGLSALKSIAYSFELPVFIENTLYGLALNALSKSTQNGLCLMDAQRGQAFALSFKVKNLRIIPEKNFPRLIISEELLNDFTGPLDFWGHAFDPFQRPNLSVLQSKIVNNFSFEKPALAAWAKLSEDSTNCIPSLSWDQIEPLYLRASAAEEKLATTKV